MSKAVIRKASNMILEARIKIGRIDGLEIPSDEWDELDDIMFKLEIEMSRYLHKALGVEE